MADQADVPARTQRDDSSSASIVDTLKYTKDVLTEFAGSAWQAGVVNKVRGVAQPFVQDMDAPYDSGENLQGMMKLAHVAGTATGQIADLAALSWGVGRGINALAARTSTTALGSLMADSAMARSVLTGGTVGLIDGGLLTPVKDDESQWQRLGNAVTEAGTFATLNGMSSRIGESFGTNLWGRVRANALSGTVAGVVDANLDAWTHGHLASTEDTLMSAAGWAVGNVAFGEGAKVLGDSSKGALNWLKGTRGSSTPESISAAIGRDVTRASEAAPLPQTRIEVGNVRDANAAYPETAGTDAKAAEARGERMEDGRPSFITASETLSMSELARKWGLKSDQALPETASESDKAALAERRQEFQKILDQYYDHFQNAFPLPGEIEAKDALRDRYLLNGKSNWDMVILRDEAKNVLGGIHYQVVDVPDAEVMKKVAWAEHIFLRKDEDINARVGRNFIQLKNIAADQIEKAGGEFVAMEFNNPAKMTQAQRDADAAAGLSANDRLWVWGRAGIHVPVDSRGEMPEYGQPDMDKFSIAAQAKKIMAEMEQGSTFDDAYKALEADADPQRLQAIIDLSKKGTSVPDAIAQTAPPVDPAAEVEEEADGSVRFLNLGFVSLKPLTGRSIPTADINKVARALHTTIPTVDVDTDPTVAWYSEHNDAIKDKYLTMVPLTAIARATEAANAARVQSMTQSIQNAVQRAIQSDIQAAVDQVITGTSYLTPQELAALPGAMSAAAKAAVEKSLKK